MANITKPVTRSVKAPRQWWSSAEPNDNNTPIATGDIFKIGVSLHGPASEVVLTTTTANTISFRTNSVVQVFPRHPAGEFVFSEFDSFIASGNNYTDTSQTPIVLTGNSSMTLTGPIDDLELCSFSGAFTVRAKR